MSGDTAGAPDLGPLRIYLDEHGLGEGPLGDVRPLGGGTQNIIVGFTRSGRRWVFRRPPQAKRPESDDVARREARILSALAGTEVPHPRLVVACADETILGAAFHVGEYVDGFSLWSSVPEPWASHPETVRQAGFDVVDAFAALARVDHVAVGLGDLGRADGWVQRQPDRWQHQLSSYAELDGHADERLDGASRVHAWLVSHTPERDEPGLVHGDAHLGNVLVRRDGGVALIDWELCTIGDPLLDLAQLLATWPIDGGPYQGRVRVNGLPSAEDLIARWEASSGRSTDDLGWFRVLASYRLAVLLEGTYARARAGLAPMATGELLHEQLAGWSPRRRRWLTSTTGAPMWDFETDPDFQAKLDWADELVGDRIEVLDLTQGSPFAPRDAQVDGLVHALQDEVRSRGLWACHLGPELGGQGYGQLQLALLNEVIGRSTWAPTIFGCQAPDSGNAEILARFGTERQKETYLQPLLAGDVCSTYAMTEPHAGADPLLFTTTAVRERDSWVINGEKWFATNARYAAFLIVMCVTNQDSVDPHGRMSMLLVPSSTPGIEIVRSVGVGTEAPGEGTHGYLRFTDVRVAADALLGEEGGAFVVAQTRLGGGRIHHAMRTIAQVRAAFDMMCERAVSRGTRTGRLSEQAVVQEQIADSWIEIEQFRLLVLRTAWLIDKHQDYRAVRGDIAAIKALMPKVFSTVVQRAMHLHGALGVSEELPFMSWLGRAEVMGIADGPTEVHKVTLARQLLRGYQPAEGLWPTAHLPTRRVVAQGRLADIFELEAAGA